MKNVKEAVGETIVNGTKEQLKKDIQENWQTYALIGAGIIGGIAGVNCLFNFINRPRTQRVDMHFYIHILTK